MSKAINISSNSTDDDVQETENPYLPEKRPPDYYILCKTCLKKRVSIIFIPCRHACLCEDCYDDLPVPILCPMCNTNVFRIYKVRIVD